MRPSATRSRARKLPSSAIRSSFSRSRQRVPAQDQVAQEVEAGSGMGLPPPASAGGNRDARSYHHPTHQIAGNRRLAQKIVRLVRGSESSPGREQSDSGSAANRALRRRAEQTFRFVRPDILFYDEDAIGLYHRIYALRSIPAGISRQSGFDSGRTNCAARNRTGLPAVRSLLFIFVGEHRASPCWYFCWYRRQLTGKTTINSDSYGNRRLPARGTNWAVQARSKASATVRAALGNP